MTNQDKIEDFFDEEIQPEEIQPEYESPAESFITVKAEKEDAGKRLDVFLSGKINETRSCVQKIIEDGLVTLIAESPAPFNDTVDTVLKSKYKIKGNEKINVVIKEPKKLNLSPENIPLDIIYEDSDIIIINKQRGLTVHPAPGAESGTLVNGLLYYCKDLSDINGVIRPGIVHRIDKDTTGLLAVAKNNKAHVKLAEQLKDHSMKREYIAIVEGVIKENSATINAPIGRHKTDRIKMAVNIESGKEAITHFTILERFNDCTLVKCVLETGRTHQIRVHMAYIGHPVAADPVYGKRIKRNIDGQALHAYKLTLTHPRTGEVVSFEAPPPEDFNNLLEELRNENKEEK